MAIIECVPNISEGRDTARVAQCVDACRVPGVTVLNASSDASHHRSVITLIGDAPGLEAAVLGLCAAAYASIDLREHSGEHPRMGAVDVVPFIPIEGVTMAECVALARRVGAAIADRFEVPVFLYEDAATTPARKNLEDVRRGEFEGLPEKLTKDEWTPDFGPRRAHPTAGACIVGARMPLIAFNINLATTRLDVARKIATAVRFSSGGLRFVKAMGVTLDGREAVQVSMNLTNYEKTPMFRVFDMVQREAARYGVAVLESEIVGLVPANALLATAEHYLQLTGFSAQQVLENKVRAATS